jgi:predicted nucleotidyltransferase
MIESGAQALVEEIAGEFATRPEVTAVILSGSTAGESFDAGSDLDLYVYAEHEPPKPWRAELARKFGKRASIGNDFWEPGDEWVALQTGNVVDIMYRSPAWIEQQLDRVLRRHQASVGYSTCFVYNVLHSKTLYDRGNWFASLRAEAEQPYPESLRRAIVAKNHPILRRTLSSYEHQIAMALGRNDHVCVNHRIAALLASYFDILFAMNRLFHPGEKRLVAHVLATCPKYPPGFQAQAHELLSAIALAGLSDVPGRVSDLLDGLDALLIDEQLIAPEPNHHS